MSQEAPNISVSKLSMKNIFANLLRHLSGANKLIMSFGLNVILSKQTVVTVFGLSNFWSAPYVYLQALFWVRTNQIDLVEPWSEIVRVDNNVVGRTTTSDGKLIGGRVHLDGRRITFLGALHGKKYFFTSTSGSYIHEVNQDTYKHTYAYINMVCI